MLGRVCQSKTLPRAGGQTRVETEYLTGKVLEGSKTTLLDATWEKCHRKRLRKPLSEAYQFRLQTLPTSRSIVWKIIYILQSTWTTPPTESSHTAIFTYFHDCAGNAHHLSTERWVSYHLTLLTTRRQNSTLRKIDVAFDQLLRWFSLTTYAYLGFSNRRSKNLIH